MFDCRDGINEVLLSVWFPTVRSLLANSTAASHVTYGKWEPTTKVRAVKWRTDGFPPVRLPLRNFGSQNSVGGSKLDDGGSCAAAKDIYVYPSLDDSVSSQQPYFNSDLQKI